MIVFSAILQFFVLRRKHRPYIWWGVLIILIALVIVGLAAVFRNGVSMVDVSDATVVGTVILTIGGQFLRAVQLVLEDYFLRDVSLSSCLIIGVEGIWGVIGTAGVFLPAVQFMGGYEGTGVHEDSTDTLQMLKRMPVFNLVISG
jgi:drug/metabolite transporter (DMT)-like permease